MVADFGLPILHPHPLSHFFLAARSVTLIPGRMSLRFLDRMQPLALVGLRLVLGAVMIAHSRHKFFGHMQDYAHFIASLGIPAWLGYVSALTEFVGGILVLIGLVTRFVAAAILIDMGVAIAKVHWSHGLQGTGGYEFPLSLAAIAFALVLFGGGPIAIDAIRSGGGGFRRGKST